MIAFAVGSDKLSLIEAGDSLPLAMRLDAVDWLEAALADCEESGGLDWDSSQALCRTLTRSLLHTQRTDEELGDRLLTLLQAVLHASPPRCSVALQGSHSARTRPYWVHSSH